MAKFVSMENLNPDSFSDSSENPAFRTEKSLLLDRIRRLLGDEDYDLLIYRLYFQLSYKEISNITNVNINTLLGRYHKIKKRLRKELKEEEEQ